jgi:RNA polymerase sigma-70 factor (ECF subfamily)
MQFFLNAVTNGGNLSSIRVKGLINIGKEQSMDDQQIIDLYWARSENAISETAKKYGKYCHAIAYHILHNDEDSEECVNDTYLNAWEAMPPHRPHRLSAFLGKITRNLSLDRYKRLAAEKRGSGQVPLALNELLECVPTADSTEKVVDDLALTESLNRFLGTLSVDSRKIFLRRYWYLIPVKEIAADFSISESKVKMSLLRSRKELKQFLEKEGITL